MLRRLRIMCLLILVVILVVIDNSVFVCDHDCQGILFIALYFRLHHEVSYIFLNMLPIVLALTSMKVCFFRKILLMKFNL